ncbi:hypothetical protein Enr17x_29540 [Gimesia fumaroli]|uniref:Uncharacterized protein n=2 Tax=Gimesia fumaroli TaxID=2527976 RepID=A0A518ICZ3_9PLAN|nr:hypothetical protein Enr17x_29540 [Gimesia fumaroli]
MHFTEEQLEQIAKWNPIDERLAASELAEEWIGPAVSRLKESGLCYCYIVETGSSGMSNYYAIAIRPGIAKDEATRKHHFKPYDGPGIYVYLSLTAPVGAIGTTSIISTLHLFAADPLELDSLIAPVKGNNEMIDAILDAFDDSIYQFLDREALSQPLPPHITPYEYCLCDEPWDRVFHVLFANTD